MKVILITGLDGSGKSTLLKRIESNILLDDYQILRLPKIDIEILKPNPQIFATASFINQLNDEADIKRVPQLKAVALFASMLLYRKLIDLATQAQKSIVYCERHPLIDTGIYAQFYAGKLAPGSISLEILSPFDQMYRKELEYLLNLLPDDVSVNHSGAITSFVNFIYQWFYIEKKTDIENLKKIFNVKLPDKIYYLQATPELLFERIKNRKILEAHESVEVFTLLDKSYKQLFTEIEASNANLIKIIDAANQTDLDYLYKKLTDL